MADQESIAVDGIGFSPYIRSYFLGPNSLADQEGEFNPDASVVYSPASTKAYMVQPGLKRTLVVDTPNETTWYNLQLPPGNWAVIGCQFRGSATPGAGDLIQLGVGKIGVTTIDYSIVTFDLDAESSDAGVILTMSAYDPADFPDNSAPVSVMGPSFDEATSSWIPRTGDGCLTIKTTSVTDCSGLLVIDVVKV